MSTEKPIISPGGFMAWEEASTKENDMSNREKEIREEHEVWHKMHPKESGMTILECSTCDLLATIDALRVENESYKLQESGWLIEQNHEGQPQWLTRVGDRHENNGFGWTADSNLAIRFSREVDAIKVLGATGLGTVVTEHIWFNNDLRKLTEAGKEK